MVDRNKTKIRRENGITEIEHSHIAYRSAPSSASRTKDRTYDDDIIASLSNAYENKRARQVFEWEQLRRDSFRHV